MSNVAQNWDNLGDLGFRMHSSTTRWTNSFPELHCLFFKIFFFFIYLFSAALGLPGFTLVVASRGYSLVVLYGLLIAMASLVEVWALGCAGFSSCGMWAQ